MHHFKKTWVSYCMHKNLQGESKVSAISCPSFLMEFGDYHIKQVMNNAPYISSMKDIYKHIEIWRMKHAIEIYKILKGIFPEMQNELLPDIPEDEVDIFEDEDDEDDLVQTCLLMLMKACMLMRALIVTGAWMLISISDN